MNAMLELRLARGWSTKGLNREADIIWLFLGKDIERRTECRKVQRRHSLIELLRQRRMDGQCPYDTVALKARARDPV